MKKMLIEKLDSFNAAPFTIQRISELLADPRKQYSRIDKFMRAVEKTILVVSTVSPGRNRSEESENGDSLDSVGLNGDFSSDVNVDIGMDTDGDGSFAMTKEFSAATHRKESHDIVTASQETITIKKVGTKEEEEEVASTSAIAAGQPAQNDITIESQSAVTITVCEPNEESKDAETSMSTEEEQSKSQEESSEQKSIEDEGVIKASEPIAPIISEPKIDEDALLNEPLRPADDEVLVDTTQTTPLAALENIVANRTVIETNEASRPEEPLQKADPVVEQAPNEQEEQMIEKSEVEEGSCESDKPVEEEIPAKRLKIDEIDSESVDAVAQQETPEITELAAADEIPPTQEKVTAAEVAEIAPIIEEPLEQSPPPLEDESSTAPTQVIEAIQPEVIEEVPVLTEPIAVVEEPIDEESQPPVVEALPAEDQKMEAAPIIENSMTLDEDSVPPPVAEMQTPNTMETDNETEGENALMDVDRDDEPMDQ
jgi:hypothetical protein